MTDHLKTTDITQTIAAFANGSQQAFAVLYDEYAAALFGTLVRVVNDETIAEDILQKSFVSAWIKRSACFHRRYGFFAWLLGIAKSHAAEAGIVTEEFL